MFEISKLTKHSKLRNFVTAALAWNGVLLLLLVTNAERRHWPEQWRRPVRGGGETGPGGATNQSCSVDSTQQETRNG